MIRPDILTFAGQWSLPNLQVDKVPQAPLDVVNKAYLDGVEGREAVFGLMALANLNGEITTVRNLVTEPSLGVGDSCQAIIDASPSSSSGLYTNNAGLFTCASGM